MEKRTRTITELIREIKFYKTNSKEHYKEYQKEFLASFKTNPSYAIRWESERMVKQQMRMVVWSNCSIKPKEVVERALEVIESSIREFLTSSRMNSTCQYTNANTIYELEGKKEAARDLAIILYSYSNLLTVEQANKISSLRFVL